MLLVIRRMDTLVVRLITSNLFCANTFALLTATEANCYIACIAYFFANDHTEIKNTVGIAKCFR